MRLPTFAILLAAVLLAGCATLPQPASPPPETAITDVAGTPLARIAAASLPDGGDALSGFRLLPEGEGAFGARLALMRRAATSLDVQYYAIAGDASGRAFLRELRDAARRGVRVRLIVDDLYTAATQPLLEGLAAEPNAQVRLFNPLPSRAGTLARRLVFSLHQFGRINHRMHNKLLVADGRFAIAGGRNIADEYFMHGALANFIDLDVLAAGAVVPQFAAIFDGYWNSEQVWPVGALTAPPPADEARHRFDALVADAPRDAPERPLDVLGAPPLADQLDAGRVPLVPGTARAFADTPAKAAGLRDEERGNTVTEQTLMLFGLAREEVAIVSPYFIPGERGLVMMRGVGATPENGRISIVTNALGATDEPLVHSRYARYRVDMLKAGVRLYEVSPRLARRSQRLGNFGRSRGALHAKVATIDRRQVFIGSMNLDPRSAYMNTEIGVAIDSAELAGTLTRLFRDGLASGAWRLRLAADGESIEWVETEPDGRETVHTREPDDGPWVRFKQWLLAPFVGDELL